MVNPLRHLDVFSPDQFGDRRVDAIGAGATGSRIVLELARLGITNIHVWDYDTVSDVNLANQAFAEEDIGSLKVDALARLVLAHTGIRIITHAEKVDGSQRLGEVVFLLTDTMESRKEIYKKALRMKLRTKLLIETRMGIDTGRVYTINPNTHSQCKVYDTTLYDDNKTEVSACGASVTVGATAAFIAGLATWQFIRWFAIQMGKEDEIETEIIFALRPMQIFTRNF